MFQNKIIQIKCNVDVKLYLHGCHEEAAVISDSRK